MNLRKLRPDLANGFKGDTAAVRLGGNGGDKWIHKELIIL